jgi:hypothetical protein
MKYEIQEDKELLGAWRVEAIGSADGECYVTVFSGPLSEQRANEYVAALESIKQIRGQCLAWEYDSIPRLFIERLLPRGA